MPKHTLAVWTRWSFFTDNLRRQHLRESNLDVVIRYKSIKRNCLL